MTPVKKQCGAATKKNDEPCTLAAGWGTPHNGVGRCKYHGGSTPSHVRKAEREYAEEAVVTFGLPVRVDAQTALLEEVHRTAGHVAWLGTRIAEFDEESLVEDVYQEGGGAMRIPSVWVRMYQAERVHLVKVSVAAVKSGIAERQVRIAEQQAQMLARVIQAVVDDLNLTPEQATRAPGIVRARLLELPVVEGSAIDV